jgi:CubicO group peptidase (beta-lactamase class C family)
MIWNNLKLCGLIFITLFFSSNVFAQTGNSVFSDNILKSKLDTAVDYAARNYLKDGNTNGVSIGIYYKGKTHVYNYGKNKLATDDMFYNIGSVAKTFVTTILAQAVIDRKVGLNDDIRKFLPGPYPNLQYNGQPVHFVNLANHTSGLPTTFWRFSPAIQDSLKKLNMAQQVHFFSRYNEDSLLSDLQTVKLDTLPGTEFQYNTAAMELLEVLLERIYEKPYEEIITSFLKTQLEMYYTKPFLTEAEIKNVVQGHNGEGKPQEFFNLRGFYLGPTMNSTIHDMLLYIKANLKNNNKAIRLAHKLTYGKESGFGIGLGWMMDNDSNGKRYIYHDGNTKIGYNTLCIFYPDNGLGFIIIANDTSSQENVGQIENNLKKILYTK